MINNIKLVSSFAGKGNFANVLVKDGYMTAQDGIVGISIKVDSDLDFCCDARRLKDVLNNCNADKLKVSAKENSLNVSSGRFRSKINTIDVNSYPSVYNDNDKVDVQGGILQELASLTQFTDPDDVRIPMRGIELSQGYLRATNGHVGIRKDIDFNSEIDPLIIPTKSISIMAKIKNEIESISVTNKMIFFNFDGGFIFTKTIDAKFPNLDKMICDIEKPFDSNELVDPLKSLAPLCDFDRGILIGKEIRTRNGDAVIEGFDIKESAFNIDYLINIAEIADTIDFDKYPGAVPFEGDKIKGVIMGIVV